MSSLRAITHVLVAHDDKATPDLAVAALGAELLWRVLSFQYPPRRIHTRGSKSVFPENVGAESPWRLIQDQRTRSLV